MKTKCPRRQELTGYVLGTLEELTSESIADHVDHCPECEASVENLEAESDTVLDKLRAGPPHDPYANEAGLRRAEALVAAVGREFTQGHQPAIESSTDDPDLGELGQYKLLAKIGAGGMGAVYKALHTRLRRVVALKVLPAERLGNESAIDRFDREMEAVGQLNHPNIVVAHDAGEVDGQHYLVMELVEGVDLSALARKTGTVPMADACEIIRQAAVGLQHAHGRGMVHRDIKPSNLMLAHTDDGKAIVKVLDMGIALLESAAPRRELTVAGQLMGTLDYMAPEQGTDTHNVDIRADVYALGATLFKLLVGKPPFPPNEYQTPLALMMAKATKNAPSLGEVRNDLPAELATLIDRMLSREPDDRPATPAALATALARFTEGSDLSALLSDSEIAPGGPTPDMVDQSELATHKHLTSESQETASESAPELTRISDRRVAVSSQGSPTVPLFSEPAVQTKTIASRKPIYMGGALTTIAVGVFIALWAAGIIFKVETKDGTLVVKVSADNFVTSVQGQQVMIKNTETDETITINLNSPEVTKPLKAGSYFILETVSGLRTSTTNFTIRSGKDKVVEVWWEPKADFAKSDMEAGDAGSKAVTNTTASREVAEWVFRQGGSVVPAAGDYPNVLSSDGLPSTEFELHIVRLPRATDDDLKRLAILPSLNSLDLRNTGITGAGLKHLKVSQHFEAFLLVGCTLLDPESLRHLEGMTDLRVLALTGTNCGDETMDRLSRWPNLQRLAPGSRVTGRGLAKVIACPKLNSLSLFGCLKLRPKDLRVLAQLPELDSLTLDTQHATPESMAVLADIPQLQSLNWLGDKGDMSLLVSLQQLTRLELASAGHAVDEDLVYLEQLKNLRQVDLRYTAVTAEGVNRFHKALPQCVIIWNGGTIKPEANANVAESEKREG